MFTLAVANHWRQLQLRRKIPLSEEPHVPVKAELAQRIIELRAACKKFRAIAILGRCSITRVESIFHVYNKKRDINLDGVLPSVDSDQTRTLLNTKDGQQLTYQQVAQEVQIPQSSVDGLHRRQKAADLHKHGRRWTPEQDEKVLGLAMQNGHDWKRLCLQMPDRTRRGIEWRCYKIKRDRAGLAEQKL
ncbi:hypothetical protein AC579_5750 [Pseudocercospora musae]|uniref:Myb-like domain-containing protein n=1 Tax=Pseudocercospora musae TaxID=113226 RepID=A0A139IRT2_9PEZI|nr:hypothetical protein AC579_5750 [Pseudocercospora musae]